MAETKKAFDMLLGFFKALGNENRLKIVAILAEQEMTVRDLAQRLNLKEPTVSEHLAQLRQTGLVGVRPVGTYRVYYFMADALHEMNKSLFSQEELAALLHVPDEDDLSVLNNYVKDGRLVIIPASRKKLLVVLRWLARHFEPGQRYAEKEVNAVILQYHEDYATLRRELIGHQFMQRDRGIYWRI